MNLTKRILAGTIAVASVFSMVGCGKEDKKDKKTETTTTTVKATLNQAEIDVIKEKAETIEGLPDIELANKEVQWLAHYPMNPNDTSAAAADLELFKIKYGGKVIDNITTWEQRYDDLASLVLANTAPDMFPADDMDAFPKGAIRGMFQPIDDYIDFDDPLWTDVEEAADSFAIKDDHYVAVIDVTPNLICPYNQKTIDENGLDDPAELFANGEWTLDKFFEMCEDFVNEDEEKYALDGFWYYDAISQTTGVPMVELNDEGLLVSNLTDPKIETVENQMYELAKKGVNWPRYKHNWACRGTGKEGDGIGDGKTLFYPVGPYALQGTPEATKLFGDVTAGEVRFVPMPLNTDGGNENHYISSRVNGYLLCTGAPNPEGYKALMYCKRACNMDEDIKALSENQLKEVYKWDDTMIDMWHTICDMALENPVFDFYHGVESELATTFENNILGSTMNKPNDTDDIKTWTQVVGEYQGAVDYLITEANEVLAGK